MKKNELVKSPDLPLVEELQSKILDLTKSLPEFKHSKKMFGRTNSQYTSQLMSLTMLGDGPYHFMKQCSAQIDTKVAALQSIYFNMKKQVYKIKRWEKKGDEYIINGGKIFITNVGEAGLLNLTARVIEGGEDKGIGAFII